MRWFEVAIYQTWRIRNDGIDRISAIRRRRINFVAGAKKTAPAPRARLRAADDASPSYVTSQHSPPWSVPRASYVTLLESPTVNVEDARALDASRRRNAKTRLDSGRTRPGRPTRNAQPYRLAVTARVRENAGRERLRRCAVTAPAAPKR